MFNQANGHLKHLVLIGLIALSPGCTPAQVEANSIRQTLQAASQNYTACKAPIYADVRYTPLSTHIPLGSYSSASLEQMESTEYPTPNEIALISNLEDRLQPCRQALVTALDSIPGDTGTPVEANFTDQDQAILILSQGHTTWGQFVATLRKANNDARQKAVAAGNALDQQLNTENNAEVAQRTQAIQNASALMQQQQFDNQQILLRQQELNAMSRPVNTTCSQFGNQTNCTSY